MRIKSALNIRMVIIAFLFLNIISAVIMISQTGFMDEPVSVTSLAQAADDEAVDEQDQEADEEKKPEDIAKIELDGLEAKRIQLQEEEERIRAERAKLKTLKKELEDKMVELSEMHKKIEVSLARLNQKKTEKERLQEAKEERKIKQLVKLYASMKPRKAGEIINNMDIVIAEKIFMNMKGDEAGQILSYVESEKAAKISERIADLVINIEDQE